MERPPFRPDRFWEAPGGRYLGRGRGAEVFFKFLGSRKKHVGALAGVFRDFSAIFYAFLC
jgi:hypothetical protein